MSFKVYVVTIVHFKGLAFQSNWQIIFYVEKLTCLLSQSHEITALQTTINNWLALICHGFLHCVAVLPVILIFPTHICWNFFWRHTSDLHLSNCCEASKPTSLLPFYCVWYFWANTKPFFAWLPYTKKRQSFWSFQIRRVTDFSYML